MSTKKHTGKILCVTEFEMKPFSEMEGFWMNAHAVLEKIDKYGIWMPRCDLEGNDAYKQIVTQIVVVAEDKVLVHKIPETGNEARLHNLFPIFFGGHVDYRPDWTDVVENAGRRVPLNHCVFSATLRELDEELGSSASAFMRASGHLDFAVGVVNLNDSDVNRDHIGIVSVLSTTKPEDVLRSTDEGVQEMSFVEMGKIDEMHDTLTPWSRVAYPMIFERYGN